MQKVYKIDDEKKFPTMAKWLIAIVLIFSIGSFAYGSFKHGILKYENGRIMYNEYRVPFFGWLKAIKDSEDKTIMKKEN